VPVQHRADPAYQCTVDPGVYELEGGEWVERERFIKREMTVPEQEDALAQERLGIDRGDVTIGPADLRQIYIGGVPVGDPFE